MNPLTPSIYKIFNHINTLNGLLFTLHDQLKNFEKLYKDSLMQSSFDISIVFSGSSIVIRDLTEWPENGFAIYYHSGKFSSKGEEYFELIALLLARESAWAVAQAYEAFERFLKDILATYLFENQDLAEMDRINKFESKKKNGGFERTEESYWRKYLEYHHKTNTDKFKFIRQICPDISKAEIENNRKLHLIDWFAIVEELRHSVTHANFLLKNGRIKNWPISKKDMLGKYFSMNIAEDGYLLNISHDEARFSLQIFSEYSFQLYKFLSITKGYSWDILK